MKPLSPIFTVSGIILALVAQTAIADNHGNDRSRNRGNDRGRDSDHRKPSRGDADYGDGFLAGLVASTAAVLLTESTAENYKELVMMGADEDAAAFLATQEQPSAILQAAIQLERGILAEAGITDLSDEDVAQVVIERAATLK